MEMSGLEVGFYWPMWFRLCCNLKCIFAPVRYSFRCDRLFVYNGTSSTGICVCVCVSSIWLACTHCIAASWKKWMLMLNLWWDMRSSPCALICKVWPKEKHAATGKHLEIHKFWGFNVLNSWIYIYILYFHLIAACLPSRKSQTCKIPDSNAAWRPLENQLSTPTFS